MNNTTPPADSGFTDAEASSLTPAFSPLYQQIKGLILQNLQSGEWKPGESIPSEMELAARYRVSQGTVRKAIDELAAEAIKDPSCGGNPVPMTLENTRKLFEDCF